MKTSLQILFVFSISILFCISLDAQVEVEGQFISNSSHKKYISVYGKDSHQVIHVEKDGNYSCRLPRFEECIIAFYEKMSEPKIVSVNTNDSNGKINRLNIRLEGQKANPKLGSGPVKRYMASNGRYTGAKFDLNKVKDKSSFGAIMVKVNKDLTRFYETGQVASELIGYSSNMDVSQLRKSEHRLGQEVFLLLEKKRGLEKQIVALQKQRTIGFKSTLKSCDADLTFLKKEASLQRVTFELAEKEADKEKMKVRRYESSGKSNYDINKVRTTAKTMLQERRKYEVAALNMKNKQADCWALRLQGEIEDEINAGQSKNSITVKVKQLELSDVRLEKRLENSLKLYRFHNELASSLTDRERHVELANAQKHISELEQIKEKQSRNNLKRWEAKNEGVNDYGRQISGAKKALAKQVEIAWQAEMAYLEHMWHLRKHPDLEDKEADDLYDRQSGLLALTPTNRNQPKEEEVVESSDTDMSILSKVKVTVSGNKRKVNMDNDEYVIIDDGTGKLRYSKNGKSITKLTYAFETKRKFGSMIKHVKVEERRQKLMDVFKKRTLQ